MWHTHPAEWAPSPWHARCSAARHGTTALHGKLRGTARVEAARPAAGLVLRGSLLEGRLAERRGPGAGVYRGREHRTPRQPAATLSSRVLAKQWVLLRTLRRRVPSLRRRPLLPAVRDERRLHGSVRAVLLAHRLLRGRRYPVGSHAGVSTGAPEELSGGVPRPTRGLLDRVPGARSDLDLCGGLPRRSSGVRRHGVRAGTSPVYRRLSRVVGGSRGHQRLRRPLLGSRFLLPRPLVTAGRRVPSPAPARPRAPCSRLSSATPAHPHAPAGAHPRAPARTSAAGPPEPGL